jgi:hypothetical protein
VFWWRDGYDFRTEPIPHLTVSGTSLDGFANPMVASTATNAQAPELGSAMLVGVDIPSTGCWKITGRYYKSELSFVVWVGA